MLFLKQLGRSPIKLTAFFLLLILSGTLCSVGLNVYHAAAEQARAIEANYTTIAIPNYMPEAYSLEFNGLDNGSEANAAQESEAITWLFLAQDERIDKVSKAIEAARNSKYVEQYEKRELIGGYCPGLTPVFNDSPGEFGTGTYTYDFAMLSISCLNQREGHFMLFKIEEVIYESAAQKAVRESLGLEEGENAPLFETIGILDSAAMAPRELAEGKRFLIWGAFSPDAGGQFQRFYPGGCIYERPGSAKTGYPEYPVYAELPEGMSAGEYMESSGQFDGVTDMFEKTRVSLQVVTTDNIMSMANFATSETPLIYGREFTAGECETGADVCVISTSLAAQNGLDVGDSFDMTLYNCQMEASINLAGISFEPYMVGFSADVPSAKFEIVGIYSDTGFTEGLFDFSPNTVFIPSGAVKDEALITHVELEYFKTRKPPKLESVVLKNGSIAAFEAEMEQAGYAQCFIYEDQGYTEMMYAERTMQSNARRLLLFSICVFLVSIALYALLYSANFRSTAVTMRLLGKTGKQTYLSAVGSAAVFAACSFIIGGVIARLVFADTFRIMSPSIEAQFSVSAALLALAVEIVAAVVPCMLFFRRCLHKSPLLDMKQ